MDTKKGYPVDRVSICHNGSTIDISVHVFDILLAIQQQVLLLYLCPRASQEAKNLPFKSIQSIGMDQWLKSTGRELLTSSKSSRPQKKTQGIEIAKKTCTFPEELQNVTSRYKPHYVINSIKLLGFRKLLSFELCKQ